MQIKTNAIEPPLSNIADALSRISAATKLLVCLGCASVVGWVCFEFGIRMFTAVMIGWDCFCLMMLCVSWTIFFSVKASQIPHLAWKNDENRLVIFVVILVIVLVSLFGIVFLMHNGDPGLVDDRWHIPFSMAGIALSWFLLHTLFTNHYAHVYYGDDEQQPGLKKGGLDFPGGDDPDYLDLAYFSFVIGMTFQVSDTQISNRTLRRLALLHGIISFLFNTIIVALTISVVANLKQ